MIGVVLVLAVHGLSVQEVTSPSPTSSPSPSPSDVLTKAYSEDGLLFTAFGDEKIVGDAAADLTYLYGGSDYGGPMNPFFWPDTANPGSANSPRAFPYLILKPAVSWQSGGCAYIQDAGDPNDKSHCSAPLKPSGTPEQLANMLVSNYTDPSSENYCTQKHGGAAFGMWTRDAFGSESAERESFIRTYNLYTEKLLPIIKNFTPNSACDQLGYQENQVSQSYRPDDVLAIGYTVTTNTYEGMTVTCTDPAAVLAAHKLAFASKRPLVKMVRTSREVVPSKADQLCDTLFAAQYDPIQFKDVNVDADVAQALLQAA